MKVALCVSGQPRCIRLAFPYVASNILARNDVTVFIHTWWDSQRDPFPEVSLYNPKGVVVETPIRPNLSKYTRVPPPQPNWKVKDPAMATYCQLYSINKCNELKKNYEKNFNVKFDWVIRTRFDFAINGVIPFDQIDNSKLYIPNCRMTKERDFGNDQFAFSSSENMDKYADTFNHIDEFYDNGTTMICEDMMSENWKLHNLVGDNLVYVDVKHPFPPGAHNGTPHSLVREDFDKWQR
jgi:hypothetical protein